MVPPQYLQQLQDVIPNASESDYMGIAQELVNSGVKLPSTVEELHALILATAKSQVSAKAQPVNSAPSFQPLLDLDEYKAEQQLHGVAQELAETKVATLAEVYEESYLSNFDQWLEDRSPLLTTNDESLQRMTLKLLHELKTERIQSAGVRRTAILAVIQNTIRYWIVGGVCGVFISVYANLSIANAIAYSGALSSVISPVVTLFDKEKLK